MGGNIIKFIMIEKVEFPNWFVRAVHAGQDSLSNTLLMMWPAVVAVV